MQYYSFYIQGSSSEPYEVIVKYSEKKFNIFCDCPAGILGQNCKHKLQVINGDLSKPSKIVSGDLDKLSSISEIVKNFPIVDALTDLTALEKEAENIKKQISVQKKKIARLLSD